MAQIMVTPAELRTAASNLREYKSSFETQVASLETSEGTLNSSWEGEANTAFHTAFLNDKAYFDAFASLIEQYCTTLETIAQKYETAENTNVSTATTRTAN